jgi:hypothetical protein
MEIQSNNEIENITSKGETVSDKIEIKNETESVYTIPKTIESDFCTLAPREHVRKYPYHYFNSGKKEYGLNDTNSIVAYEPNEMPSALADCVYEILEFGVWTILQEQDTFKLIVNASVKIDGTLRFEFVGVSPDIMKFIKDNKVFENYARNSQNKK